MVERTVLHRDNNDVVDAGKPGAGVGRHRAIDRTRELARRLGQTEFRVGDRVEVFDDECVRIKSNIVEDVIAFGDRQDHVEHAGIKLSLELSEETADRVVNLLRDFSLTRNLCERGPLNSPASPVIPPRPRRNPQSS